MSLCSIQVAARRVQNSSSLPELALLKDTELPIGGAGAALAVLVKLVGDEGRAAGAGSDIHQDLEAHRHARVDPGAAEEAETGREVRVVEAVVGPGHMAVIPPQDRPVHVAGDGQRHLAVALASGRRLELGNALLEIGAAVAAKVGRLGRRHRHATHKQTGRGKQRHSTARLQESPDHSYFSVGRTPIYRSITGGRSWGTWSVKGPVRPLG